MSNRLVAGGAPIKPLLEVRDLKKYFPLHKGFFGRKVGDVKAVDGVSLDVYPRETLGVVGESGCGKTTVGRTILRLLEPTAGSAVYEGQDIFGLKERELRALRRHMQIIFQDPYSSLNPRMTVGSIIADALELHGLAKGEERFDRAKDLLERVGLQASYVNRYPHEFSGGQRQRIGIARAVALQPRFVVCDEAVSALDVSVQAQVLNLLQDLQEEYQLSYLFIAHDLAVVRHIADRIAVMYLGRIVELATCDDLFEAPLHPYTQALLSAVPIPKPGRKHKRVILKGDVPNPINPPAGCHFHTRCPVAFDRCSVEVPATYDARPGHKVQCHLYDGADFPAEPVPIDGPAAHAARARRSAADSPVAEDTLSSWSTDETDGFDAFDGSEEMDGRNIGIPAVLADRSDIGLGPFGEVVDPEDTFVGGLDIPTLGSMIGEPDVTVRRTAPAPDSEPTLPPDAPPGRASEPPAPRGLDPDATATIADLPTITDADEGEPAGPDKSVDLSLGPVITDSIPPVYDDDGILDDISLHAATIGGVPVLEEQETLPLTDGPPAVPRRSGSPAEDPTISTELPLAEPGYDG